MKKAAAFITAISILLLTGCGGVRLNFSGVSPFRNIRDEAVISAVDQAVDDYQTQSGGEGVSAAVMHGKETYFTGRGSMNEHTVMPVGDMTQMFMGMLVSHFENRKYVDKTAGLSDRLKTPEALPEAVGSLELWQLACNISGLGGVDTGEKDYFTAGMLYEQLGSVALEYEPGTQRHGSEMGYALLTEYLRQSYNMNANFVNMINNEVITRFDLQDSSFARRDMLAAYDGYQSTVYDLLKVAGYCGGMLENDETLSKLVSGAEEEMWSGDGQRVSLAFDVSEIDGYTLYSRSGESGGVMSYVAFIPELSIGVSAISDGGGELSGLCAQLIEAVK